MSTLVLEETHVSHGISFVQQSISDPRLLDFGVVPSKCQSLVLLGTESTSKGEEFHC